MKYLVAFDISNTRRRNAVVKCCLGVGFRVQKSVFEIFLESCRLGTFEESLLGMINAETDSVRIYPLDKLADSGIHIIGCGKRIENKEVRFI